MSSAHVRVCRYCAQPLTQDLRLHLFLECAAVLADVLDHVRATLLASLAEGPLTLTLRLGPAAESESTVAPHDSAAVAASSSSSSSLSSSGAAAVTVVTLHSVADVSAALVEEVARLEQLQHLHALFAASASASSASPTSPWTLPSPSRTLHSSDPNVAEKGAALSSLGHSGGDHSRDEGDEKGDDARTPPPPLPEAPLPCALSLLFSLVSFFSEYFTSDFID